jgi:hypothetical protein
LGLPEAQSGGTEIVKNGINKVRFVVLTATYMKTAVVWDVTLYSLVDFSEELTASIQ